MNRSEILAEAERCVCHNRQEEYGPIEDNFKRISEFWNTYLGVRLIANIDAEDVAVMMSLLKIARIASGQTKADNFIDLAGYASCAGEIATKE